MTQTPVFKLDRPSYDKARVTAAKNYIRQHPVPAYVTNGQGFDTLEYHLVAFVDRIEPVLRLTQQEGDELLMAILAARPECCEQTPRAYYTAMIVAGLYNTQRGLLYILRDYGIS